MTRIPLLTEDNAKRSYAPLPTNVPLYVYSHSYGLIPGLRCSANGDWPTLSKTAAGLRTVTSYAIGGTFIHEQAAQAIGISANSAVSAFVSNAALPTNAIRPGIFVIDTEITDSTYSGDLRTLTPRANPSTAYLNAQSGVLRAFIAAISSGSRVEVEAGTLTGSWTTNTDTTMSGGSCRVSAAGNDTAAIPVTVPVGASGVWVLLYSLNPGVFTVASASIAVDGVVVRNVSTAELTMQPYLGRDGSSVGVEYAAFWVSAASGTHTITVKNTAGGAATLAVDAVLIQAPNPPRVIVAQDGPAVAGGGSAQWTAEQITILTANRALVQTAYKAVVSEFVNAAWMPSTITEAGISSVDGVHPNDRGMVSRAKDFVTAFRALTTTDSNGLYAIL